MRHSALPLLVLAATLALLGCSSESGQDDPLDTPHVDTADSADDVGDTAAPPEDGASDAPSLTDTGGDGLDASDTAQDLDEGPGADTQTSGDTGGDGLDGDAAQIDVSPQDVDPDAPYAELEGLTGEALRGALQTVTYDPHQPLDYDGARDEMYAVGGIEDHGGRIECIYTGRSVDANGSRTPSNNCTLADGTPTTCNLNTEHTWARYYLDRYLTEGTLAYQNAEGDLHHIFPSDDDVNTARWHFEFGWTDCLSLSNCVVDEKSQLGIVEGSEADPACVRSAPANDQDCFMQVREERRGDIARAQFYMAVRYGMPIDDGMEAALRQWNQADAPDDRERARNDAIEGVQGNRNPFVDRPDFVDRIADF